jgi:hypothetical protein
MILDLARTRFGVGKHDAIPAPTGDRDLCIMEAVAYVAGEPWSDAPACASPVVSAFLRNWNDSLPDAERDRLLPADVWVLRLVGSHGSPEIEERRAYLALDWLIRTYAPMWLDLVPDLRPHAAALRGLPGIVDLATAERAGQAVRPARAAARAAAWDAARAAARAAAWAAAGATAGAAARAAAGDAAWAAAWDAARVAARAAAWDAARAAARAAAWDAAWDAAGDAARAAARDAARDRLRPTVEAMQASALDLLDRMLRCGETAP